MLIDIIADFLTELANSKTPEEELKKENIVSQFLTFAERTKGYDKKYFFNKYDDIAANLLDKENFEEYIYRCCLCFYSDALMEYIKIKNWLEESLNYLEKAKLYAIGKRREIKRRSVNGEEVNDPDYSKYDYYLKYFIDRISNVKKCLVQSELIKHSLKIARTPYWKRMGLYSFNTINDYTIMNGHEYIWFGMLPVQQMEKICALRRDDRDLYVEAFAKIIREYSIIENMIEICEKNYYLYQRLNIIRSAAGLFKREEYEAFSYLMVSQTEGMFGDYLSLCDVDFEKKDGMTTKIEKVKEYTPIGEGAFVEYAYFKYDFPALRNPMAHGVVMKVDRETAFEILMDAYWVVREIDSNKHRYKKWINFLQGFSSLDNGRAMLLKRLCSKNLEYKSYIELLNIWLCGDFKQLIEFYHLSVEERLLRECLNSAKLYYSIWSDMPLKSEDKSLHMDGMRIMRWNDKPLFYQGLVDFAKENHFEIPDGWLSNYYNFIDAMNKEKERCMPNCNLRKY